MCCILRTYFRGGLVRWAQRGRCPRSTTKCFQSEGTLPAGEGACRKKHIKVPSPIYPTPYHLTLNYQSRVHDGFILYLPYIYYEITMLFRIHPKNITAINLHPTDFLRTHSLTFSKVRRNPFQNPFSLKINAPLLITQYDIISIIGIFKISKCQ